MTSEKSPARRGRPVDPEIEPRVFQAALEVYREAGWAGFTIDAVARRAKVGKAAIYSRWSTKQELAAAAFTSLRRPDFSEDVSGGVREELRQVARRVVNRYVGPHGLTSLRIQLEAKVYPEALGEAMDAIRVTTIERAGQVLTAAVERGELPSDTDPSLVRDALIGTIIHRTLMMSEQERAETAADPSRLVEQVVDFVLSGVAGTGSSAD